MHPKKICKLIKKYLPIVLKNSAFKKVAVWRRKTRNFQKNLFLWRIYYSVLWPANLHNIMSSPAPQHTRFDFIFKKCLLFCISGLTFCILLGGWLLVQSGVDTSSGTNSFWPFLISTSIRNLSVLLTLPLASKLFYCSTTGSC